MKRSETVAMLQFHNGQPGSGHSRQHGFATWCEAGAMPAVLARVCYRAAPLVRALPRLSLTGYLL